MEKLSHIKYQLGTISDKLLTKNKVPVTKQGTKFIVSDRKLQFFNSSESKVVLESINFWLGFRYDDKFIDQNNSLCSAIVSESGHALTEQMQNILKDNLNYNQIMALYKKCQSVESRNVRQTAFIDFVDNYLIGISLKYKAELIINLLSEILNISTDKKLVHQAFLTAIVEGKDLPEGYKTEAALATIIAQVMQNNNAKYNVQTRADITRLAEKAGIQLSDLKCPNHIQELIQQSKADFQKQTRNPDVLLAQFQRSEDKIIKNLERKLKFFNSESSNFENEHFFPNELNFITTNIKALSTKIDFIKRLPSLNTLTAELATIHNDISSCPSTVIGEKQELDSRINNIIETFSLLSGQENNVSVEHKVLFNQYCAMIRHYLNYQYDYQQFKILKKSFEDINLKTKRVFQDITNAVRDKYIAVSKNTNNTQFLSTIKEPLLQLHRLKIPENNDGINEYFNGLNKILEEIHRLELSFLHSATENEQSVFLKSNQEHILQNLNTRVYKFITVAQLDKISAIKKSEDRELDRKKEFAKIILFYSLESTSHGAYFKNIILKPNKEIESEAGKLIKQSAQRMLDNLLERYSDILRNENEVYSNQEFASKMQIDLGKHKLNLDLEKICPKLEESKIIDSWYKELQKIWVETMSVIEAEELIKLNNTENNEKITKLFAKWMLKHTGIQFDKHMEWKEIYFNSIVKLYEAKEPNNTANNLTRVQHCWQHKHNKTLPMDSLNKKAQQVQKYQPQDLSGGFPEAWLNRAKLDPIHSFSKVKKDFTLEFCQIAPGELSIDYNIQYLKNNPYPVDNTIQKKIDWILSAYNKMDKPVSKNVGIYFYACLLDVIKQNEFDRNVSDEIFDIFMDVSFSKEWKLSVFEQDNTWRKEFINGYLKFLEQKEPLNVTEENRKYLFQLYNLVDKKLPTNIKVSDTADDIFGISGVAKNLQKSVGLEGLCESEIQFSFQTSGHDLPDNSKTRDYIDFLRARGNQNLSRDLIQYVLTYSRMSKEEKYSHEDWERASRAFIFALQGKQLDEVETFFADLTQFEFNNDTTEIDQDSLAPTLNILKMDIILDMFPQGCKNYDDAIKTYNAKLMQFENTGLKLVGYSREIVRLTRLLKETPNDRQVFADLLRIKLAYDNIKKTYFDNDSKIVGFLKTAVDRAEHEMVSSVTLIQNILQQIGANDIGSIAKVKNREYTDCIKK